MRYQTYMPRIELSPFVECFWHLESTHSLTAKTPELVLPDGNCELIVHFGDTFARTNGSGVFESQSRSLFAAQLTEKTFLLASGNIGMVSVRFKPFGASRFFKADFSEYVDQVPDLEHILKSSAGELEEKIDQAKCALSRFQILEDFLFQRLKKLEEDVVFSRSCNLILSLSANGFRLSEIAQKIGYSERQIERKFKEKIGLSPKVLVRIRRLQNFLHLKQINNDITIENAALASGYFDLPHLNREFKSFTGLSPTQYFSGCHTISDFFTSPS